MNKKTTESVANKASQGAIVAKTAGAAVTAAEATIATVVTSSLGLSTATTAYLAFADPIVVAGVACMVVSEVFDAIFDF